MTAEQLNDLIVVSPFFIVVGDVVLFFILNWLGWIFGKEMFSLVSPAYAVLRHIIGCDDVQPVYFLAFWVIFGLGFTLFLSVIRTEYNANFIPFTTIVGGFVGVSFGAKFMVSTIKKLMHNRKNKSEVKKENKSVSNDANSYV